MERFKNGMGKEHQKWKRRYGPTAFQKQERHKEHLESKLANIVAEQRYELADQNLELFLSNNSQVLLGAYEKTQQYQGLWHEAQKISPADTDLKTSLLRDRLTGRFFSDLSFLVMAAREEALGRTVLSPERTFMVYKRLFPEREVISHMFNQKGLRGISVSDGMLIDDQSGNPKIIGLFEYSSQKYDNFKFETKRSAYMKNRSELRNRYPNICSNDSRIIFVFPTAQGLNSLPAVWREKDIELKTISTTHSNIKEFIDILQSKIYPQVNRKND